MKKFFVVQKHSPCLFIIANLLFVTNIALENICKLLFILILFNFESAHRWLIDFFFTNGLINVRRKFWSYLKTIKDSQINFQRLVFTKSRIKCSWSSDIINLLPLLFVLVWFLLRTVRVVLVTFFLFCASLVRIPKLGNLINLNLVALTFI